jgi:hypothetical protein
MPARSLRTDEILVPRAVTRLVVLGDPHGDLAGLEAVLAREPEAKLLSAGDNIGYAGGPASSRLCSRLESLGIASVYGNHEAWLGEDGTLAIALDTPESKRLSPEAQAWCRSLPLCFRVRLEGRPELSVGLTHSIVGDDDAPTWEFVSRENVERVAGLGGADLIFIGHSHGPAIYAMAPGRPVQEARLDFDDDAPVVVEILPGHRYVVDAGSLARPGHHPHPGRFELATYAALDIAEGRLELHAVRKLGAREQDQ